MLWATQSCGWYEQLSMLWDQASRCYEQLIAKDDFNDSWLWSYLIAINSLELWMTWTTSSHELKAQDAMNNSGLCMTWTTLGRGLRALDAINNLGLCMTWMTQGHLLSALNVTNRSRLWWTSMNFGSWAQGFRCYEQLKIVDYINDFELWA